MIYTITVICGSGDPLSHGPGELVLVPEMVHSVRVECEDAVITQALGQLMSFVGYKEETKHEPIPKEVEAKPDKDALRNQLLDMLHAVGGLDSLRQHEESDQFQPERGANAKLYGGDEPDIPIEPDSSSDGPEGV